MSAYPTLCIQRGCRRVKGVLAVLAPGQGSQKPGMAKDLVEAFPAAREVFDRMMEGKNQLGRVRLRLGSVPDRADLRHTCRTDVRGDVLVQ